MKRVDIGGLAWADIKSNEFKKMPQAPIRLGNRSSIRVPCIMYSDHSRLSYDH
jgi:hypothetical protein